MLLNPRWFLWFGTSWYAGSSLPTHDSTSCGITNSTFRVLAVSTLHTCTPRLACLGGHGRAEGSTRSSSHHRQHQRPVTAAIAKQKQQGKSAHYKTTSSVNLNTVVPRGALPFLTLCDCEYAPKHRALMGEEEARGAAMPLNRAEAPTAEPG